MLEQRFFEIMFTYWNTVYLSGAEDQRLQPWYIEGVRGPKNIIILFDISYAMKEENKYKFARTAVIQVLKGMLNNDFTNVRTHV